MSPFPRPSVRSKRASPSERLPRGRLTSLPSSPIRAPLGWLQQAGRFSPSSCCSGPCRAPRVSWDEMQVPQCGSPQLWPTCLAAPSATLPWLSAFQPLLMLSSTLAASCLGHLAQAVSFSVPSPRLVKSRSRVTCSGKPCPGTLLIHSAARGPYACALAGPSECLPEPP